MPNARSISFRIRGTRPRCDTHKTFVWTRYCSYTRQYHGSWGRCTAVVTELQSAFFFFKPKTFAVLYTFGNVTALCSTAFLIGPRKQLKNMFARKRIIATVVYLLAIILTILVALVFHVRSDRAAGPPPQPLCFALLFSFSLPLSLDCDIIITLFLFLFTSICLFVCCFLSVPISWSFYKRVLSSLVVPLLLLVMFVC